MSRGQCTVSTARSDGELVACGAPPKPRSGRDRFLVQCTQVGQGYVASQMPGGEIASVVPVSVLQAVATGDLDEGIDLFVAQGNALSAVHVGMVTLGSDIVSPSPQAARAPPLPVAL